MQDDHEPTYNLFTRLFWGIGQGCLLGLLGGIVSGALGGFMFWGLSRIFPEGLHVLPIDLGEFVNGEVQATGVPVGLIIGFGAGLNRAIFNTLRLQSLRWAIVACLGATLGLWLSHLSDNYPDFVIRVASYAEVACIAVMTGWAAHRFTRVNPGDPSGSSRRAVILVSLVSGLLITFAATYY